MTATMNAQMNAAMNQPISRRMRRSVDRSMSRRSHRHAGAALCFIYRATLLIAVCLLGLLIAPTAWSAPRDPLLDQVGFDQHMGVQLPVDARFRDESGRVVRLGDYFSGRPGILVLAYFNCPNLCNTIVAELAARLRDINLKPGRDYQVVVASFDPRDTPSRARAQRVRYFPGAKRLDARGWHFLVADEATIQSLTRTVGFRYAWDAKRDEYAHPGGVMILTPEARMARYVFALGPQEAALHYGLIEAAGHRIGTPIDRLWLLCHSYDPVTGRYGPLIESSTHVLGAFTMASMFGALVWLRRRDRRAKRG
jgi:protein SCO1/2